METVYFNSFSGADTHGAGSSYSSSNTLEYALKLRYKNLIGTLLRRSSGYYTVPVSGIYAITKWDDVGNVSTSSSEMRRLCAGDVITHNNQQIIVSRVSS